MTSAYNALVQIGQNPVLEGVIKDLKDEINVLKTELAEKEKKEISEQNAFDKSKKEENKKIETLQNKIINQFDEEIKIRKEIINKEREKEELKNEKISQQLGDENYINLTSLKKKNSSTIESEINSKTAEINSLYIKQATLIDKRKNLQKEIVKLSKETNNPFLQNIYKYYISFLENLSSEHRKYLNQSELLRKEKQIESLIKQLDYRDDFIMKAGEEIERNRGTFKHMNKNFQTLAEIEMNPYKLPVIQADRVTPMKIINNLNAKKPIQNAGNTIIVGDKKITEKFLMGPEVASKKRQYNADIVPILIGNKDYNRVNSPLQKLKRRYKVKKIALTTEAAEDNKIQRKMYNPSLDFSTNNGKYGYTRSNDYSTKNRKVVMFTPDRYNKYSSYKNITLNTSSGNSSTKQNSANNQSLTSSRFENEIQKKVKTILTKNFIGRYKNSPYILKDSYG